MTTSLEQGLDTSTKSWISERRRRYAVGSMLAALVLSSCGVDSADKINASATAATATTAAAETVYEIDRTACAAEGEPVVTLHQRLCPERRTGELAVVAVTELEPVHDTLIDLSEPSGELYDVTKYAADYLQIATEGQIDLTPRVVKASPEVADLIRERNDSECIDPQDPKGYMGVAVEELMPEVADATQLVAYGGESCEVKEGQVIGGHAGFTTEHNEADVYNRKAISFLELGEQTDITRAGHTIMHELLHNLGLGHAGSVHPNDPSAGEVFYRNPSGIIDLRRYLADAYYAEYGALGNIMASTTAPMKAGDIEVPDIALSQLQIDYINRGIDPEGYMPEVLPFQMGESSLTVEPANDDSPVGLSVAVTEYVPLGDYEFSHVNFLVYQDDSDDSYVDIVLSTPPYGHERLTTATLAYIKLEESRPLSIDVDGSSKIAIAWDGEKAKFTKVA